MGKNAALMFHYASKGKEKREHETPEYNREKRDYGEYERNNGNRYGYSDRSRDNWRDSPEYGKENRHEYGEYNRDHRERGMREEGMGERYRGKRKNSRYEDDDYEEEDYRHSKKERPLTEASAKKWVDKMQNPEDKSKPGEHWNMAQTAQVLNQMKLPYDPVEFYVVMNMMYSDYYGVAKKYGQDRNTDFFVDLSKAWLDDSDSAAGDKKTEMYYNIVAK